MDLVAKSGCRGILVGFESLSHESLVEIRKVFNTRKDFHYTIIAREHWGQSVLGRIWSRHAFTLANEIRRESPDTRVYWFLISSGYKAYRFLSKFFEEFYPTHERPTPKDTQRVMDTLATERFLSEYDPEAGVVRPALAAPLRPGVADITERRMRDPHVEFFARANPGHARGDELVRLAELLPANLTAAGHRMLGVPKPLEETGGR